jgi:hypothetical protein
MEGLRRADAVAAHAERMAVGDIQPIRIRLRPTGDCDASEIDGCGRSRVAWAMLFVFAQHARVSLCRVPQTTMAIPGRCREMAI